MLALLKFMRHDVMRSDLAYAWLAKGVLQPVPDKLEDPDSGEESWGALCIRFTTAGRKLAQKLKKQLRISAKDFESLEDPFKDSNCDPRDRFLMHDRRFRDEILSDSFREIALRYDKNMDFQEASKLYGSGKSFSLR